VNQLALDLQAVMKRTVSEKIEKVGDTISTQSSRNIKSTATSMVTTIRELSKRASDLGRELSAKPVGGAARASERFAESAAAACAYINKLSARDSSYPEMLAELGEMAVKRTQMMVAAFDKNVPGIEDTTSFMYDMVRGTTEKRSEIDQRLEALASGWTLDRQAAVDRNIMRLAAYEILFEADIPAGASINEAVELAKKYSTAESGRFVNGILGALAGNSPSQSGKTVSEPEPEPMEA
jgi:N utilization substance protein B